MTAHVTASLQNLLRSLASPMRSLMPAAACAAAASGSRHEHDAADTQPMLFRSECFPEDLFDSYPSH